MRRRGRLTTLAVLLFLGGWGVYFASAAVGFAMMGTGALLVLVILVGDMRADGTVHLSRAWREQSRQMRNGAGSGGGWFGGDVAAAAGSAATVGEA